MLKLSRCCICNSQTYNGHCSNCGAYNLKSKAYNLRTGRQIVRANGLPVLRIRSAALNLGTVDGSRNLV